MESTMGKSIGRLVLGLMLVTAAAAQSMWELRGDRFLQAGNPDKAVEAYEIALSSEPENGALQRKLERALLSAYLSQGDVNPRQGGVTRMLPPEEPPVEEAGSVEGDQPETSPASAGPGTTAPASGQAADPGGVRVRSDGVVEVDFRSLLRPVTRIGEEPAKSEDPEKPKGPTVYGTGQIVNLERPRQGFEGTRGEGLTPENVTIRSANYEISGVSVGYSATGDLHIKGTIVNMGAKTVRLPRVYCRIMDEVGMLRGRNFSYVSPGRNSLPPNKPKTFDVQFRGYREPVASYQFEVVP